MPPCMGFRVEGSLYPKADTVYRARKDMKESPGTWTLHPKLIESWRILYMLQKTYNVFL